MLSYETLRNQPRILQSLTGLSRPAFQRLLPSFAQLEEELRQQADRQRTAPRQRRPGGGRTATLRTSADRLLFILFYFRQYPTQETLAFFFGMSQGTACQWIHRLIPVLNAALGEEQQLPARTPADVRAVLAACPRLEFLIDGTERPVARPQDPQRRKALYSGRKKRHTVKHIVVTERRTRKIKALGRTRPGRQHDKPAAEEDQFAFPPGSTLWQDTGFQGYAPAHVTCCQPTKKPKGRELTARQRRANRRIARVRIGIEHSLAGVKIFRIVHDVYRGRWPEDDDQVMETACGLFNFRCEHRRAA